jgi:hypothetical protein
MVIVRPGERGTPRLGVHRRHGRLDAEWKDVLVVERFSATLGTREMIRASR